MATSTRTLSLTWSPLGDRAPTYSGTDRSITGSWVSARGITLADDTTLGYPAPGVFKASSWGQTIASSLAANKQFHITLTRADTVPFNVDSLTIPAARGATSGTRGFAVYASDDAFTAPLPVAPDAAEMNAATMTRPTLTNFVVDTTRLRGRTGTLEIRVVGQAPASTNTLDFGPIKATLSYTVQVADPGTPTDTPDTGGGTPDPGVPADDDPNNAANTTDPLAGKGGLLARLVYWNGSTLIPVYLTNDFSDLDDGDGPPDDPNQPADSIDALPQKSGEILVTYDFFDANITKARVSRNGVNQNGTANFFADDPVAAEGSSTRLFTGLVNGFNYTFTVTPFVGGTTEEFLRPERALIDTAAPQPDAPDEPDGPDVPPPVPVTEFDASWAEARRLTKAQRNPEILRKWYEANVVGPRIPISGTHPGGAISTQTQANAMVGKRVTGNVTVSSGTFTIHDCIIQGSYTQTGGTVTWNDVLYDRNDITSGPAPFKPKGGTLYLNRVEIRKSQDAIQPQGTATVRARYLYIHEPSQLLVNTQEPSANSNHQDGIQCMGGTSVFERTFIDYRRNHSGGQGIIIKADSARIRLFAFNESFLQADHNMVTAEPKWSAGGWPDAFEFKDFIVAGGNTSSSIISFYDSYQRQNHAPLTSEQRNRFLQWTMLRLPSGTTVQFRNGLSSKAPI